MKLFSFFGGTHVWSYMASSILGPPLSDYKPSTALYGSRLVRMMPYGLQARDNADPESDMDVLVALQGPVPHGEEISRTGDMIPYDLRPSDRRSDASPRDCKDAVLVCVPTMTC